MTKLSSYHLLALSGYSLFTYIKSYLLPHRVVTFETSSKIKKKVYLTNNPLNRLIKQDCDR